MSKYRKKPVVVEARRLYDQIKGIGCRWDMKAIAEWCGGEYREIDRLMSEMRVVFYIDIPTLEGTMRAEPCDWIIQGVKGEFYPCKPDIFEATYERVEA